MGRLKLKNARYSIFPFELRKHTTKTFLENQNILIYSWKRHWLNKHKQIEPANERFLQFLICNIRTVNGTQYKVVTVNGTLGTVNGTLYFFPYWLSSPSGNRFVGHYKLPALYNYHRNVFLSLTIYSKKLTSTLQITHYQNIILISNNWWLSLPLPKEENKFHFQENLGQ